MDQISNLKIKLEAETAKFTEEINKAKKSLDGFGKTHGGINLTKIAIGGLATAALAATGAVVYFVSSCILYKYPSPRDHIRYRE